MWEEAGTVSRGAQPGASTPGRGTRDTGVWGEDTGLCLLSWMDLCADSSVFSLGPENESGVCVARKMLTLELTEANFQGYTCLDRKDALTARG